MEIENRFLHASIEFHDSTIGSIRREGVNLTIDFAPAYLHRSAGIPGVDPGTGWTQEVLIVLRCARLSGEIPQLPLTLAGGSLTLGTLFHNNCLPVPFDYLGEVKLVLLFEDSSDLQIVAEEIHLILIGNPIYVEDFPG